MSILKVARLGHPVLREKASDLEVKDIKAGKFRPLIDDMIETMHAYEGVGLAGPQVHLPLRIFVFRHVVLDVTHHFIPAGQPPLHLAANGKQRLSAREFQNLVDRMKKFFSFFQRDLIFATLALSGRLPRRLLLAELPGRRLPISLLAR